MLYLQHSNPLPQYRHRGFHRGRIARAAKPRFHRSRVFSIETHRVPFSRLPSLPPFDRLGLEISFINFFVDRRSASLCCTITVPSSRPHLPSIYSGDTEFPRAATTSNQNTRCWVWPFVPAITKTLSRYVGLLHRRAVVLWPREYSAIE